MTWATHDDLVVLLTWTSSGFNVQLQNTSDPHDNFQTLIKNIEVTRGPVVRLYAIFIVLVICRYLVVNGAVSASDWDCLPTGLVTLTFMATCLMCVFFGKGISSGVLVLPMGTLFAFTQLRSTLPGAPEGFGTCGLISSSHLVINMESGT